MNRRQRAVLLFGLLLIGAAVLGRAQQANAAQAGEESAATLESGKPPTEHSDPGLDLAVGDDDRSAWLQ
jgi:hypothetical protein